MPRRPRFNVPGVVYHVVSRFVDRDWYIRTDREREHYLELFGRAVSRSDWRCLGYAVMSNHIHLALVAGEQRLESWIRRAHSPFADALNRAYDRIGSVFVRGPKDVAIPDGRVDHLLAYIHNNPVRAEIVPQASESTWTSHRAYVGLARSPSWLHVAEGLERTGVCESHAFDRWVGTRPPHPLELEPGAEARATFESIVEAYERAEILALKKAELDAMRPHIGAPEIVELTADELRMPMTQLRSKRRGFAEVFARTVAVRCGWMLGVTTVEMARALGVTQQAVSQLRRRDDSAAEVRDVSERVLKRLQRIARREASLVATPAGTELST
jgi:putative transposase